MQIHKKRGPRRPVQYIQTALKQNWFTFRGRLGSSPATRSTFLPRFNAADAFTEYSWANEGLRGSSALILSLMAASRSLGHASFTDVTGFLKAVMAIIHLGVGHHSTTANISPCFLYDFLRLF